MEQRADKLQQMNTTQRERLAAESAEEREARILHVNTERVAAESMEHQIQSQVYRKYTSLRPQEHTSSHNSSYSS